MPLSRSAVSALLLFCGLSTACATPEPVVVRQVIPPALLSCQPEPEPPAVLRDDSELAYWVIDLAAAGADCRAKLMRVKELTE